MRCLACGEEMVLTAVMPAGPMSVAGFEQQTFACLVCRTTERRFVFDRGASETPVSSPVPLPAAQPVPPCSQPNGTTSQPDDLAAQPDGIVAQPDGIAPAHAWTRAVEKLRNRQANLNARAEETRKTDWNIRFNREWEKLAPAPRQQPPTDDPTPARRKDISGISARALRAQLRTALGRNRPKQPAVEPTAEAVQIFNQFWDSLVPARNSPPAQTEASASLALLEPLPRSVSLVPVESVEAMSAGSRAILLLRGPQHVGA
jgi:hypothetical protein